jgi:lipopolysaccharide/colanic/teichoic acid biosynthesis glycosyltransferase
MSELEATAASASLFEEVRTSIGREAERKADDQDIGWQRARFVAALLLTDAVVGGLALIGAISICAQEGLPQMDLADSLSAELPIMLALLMGLYGLLGLYSMRMETLLERFRCRATVSLIFGLVGMLLWARGESASDAGSFALGGALSLVLGSWTEQLRKSAFARWTTGRMPISILATGTGTGTGTWNLGRLSPAAPAFPLRPIAFAHDGGAKGGADDCSVGPNEANPALAASEASAGPLAVEPGQLSTWWEDRLKRALDLALVVPLTMAAAPVIGLGWLAVKICDPGPAFYWQWRLGRYGSPIKVFKLRTMYQDADQRLERVLANDAAMREQWQRYFKLPDDPRILPYIGTFLRRSSIDELPQLWNILRGDMSLVGPRPFPKYHMEAFDAEFRALRLTVPPGLTGLWQISSRSEGDLDVQRAQDCLYIHNRSLWLDLYILVATIPALIVGRGAH